MKIKCPWFGDHEEENVDESNKWHVCEKYCRNEKELYNHIVNHPHHNIAKKFARQTFKIHERKMKLENEINTAHESIYHDQLIAAYESLLENEK